MDYIQTEPNGQLVFSQFTNLMIPSALYGFTNTDTSVKNAASGRKIFLMNGTYHSGQKPGVCSQCGTIMHKNNHLPMTLRHLPFGSGFTHIRFDRLQCRCPKCNKTWSEPVLFKAPDHMITNDLLTYTRDLLASNNYTLKEVASLTGLGKNTVKDIDKKRLQEKYVVNNSLIKPEKQARFLGIDEFKLHDGYVFATHIIDLENGHVLWIAEGKKKKVVYDFIEHVGMEWMEHVEAVACDMNSDFQEAFEERCPHIRIVFDHFHIIKNFNEKVVSEVRKEEQRRLVSEGNEEGAKSLKKTRFILTSKRATLKKKDNDAREQKPIRKGSGLFKTKTVTRKEGYESRYDALLEENKLLFRLDLIKEKLDLAYTRTEESLMKEDLTDIIDLCEESGNKHLLWFKKLLERHLDGITSYAVFKLSSGKIEGINQKIKTVRRQAYGLPDDEYFFLKVFDMSRTEYVRNPKSHKICD